MIYRPLSLNLKPEAARGGSHVSMFALLTDVLDPSLASLHRIRAEYEM